VELSTTTLPDYVDMIIVPSEKTVENFDENPTFKKENGGLLGTSFELSIETELDADPRTSGTDKIFTGQLANLSPSGEGSWEGIAYDPSHQAFASGEGDANSGNFLNTEIDIESSVRSTEEFGEELGGDPVESGGYYYPTPSEPTPAATKISAIELVDKIIEASPIDKSQARTHFKAPPGYKVSDSYAGINNQITFSKQKIKVSKALEDIETKTNSTWWFDKDGIFHIGAARPGNPIQSYNLQFITNTSAGTATPPWQSVQVIGNGVVSEDGWAKANMNTTEVLTSTQGLADDENRDTEQLADPVYTYRNLEIQTQAEADATAQKIIEEFNSQSSEGKVTVVGFPEIRPLDAIQMPNSADQPMGGARYAVKKVIHKINPSDGFVSVIHTGGATSAQQAVYETERNDTPIGGSPISGAGLPVEPGDIN
jgi:hypothetical protein